MAKAKTPKEDVFEQADNIILTSNLGDLRRMPVALSEISERLVKAYPGKSDVDRAQIMLDVADHLLKEFSGTGKQNYLECSIKLAMEVAKEAPSKEYEKLSTSLIFTNVRKLKNVSLYHGAMELALQIRPDAVAMEALKHSVDEPPRPKIKAKRNLLHKPKK